MEEDNQIQIKERLLGDEGQIHLEPQPFRSKKQSASLFSRIFFIWAFPLIRVHHNYFDIYPHSISKKQGNKTHLEQSHLEELSGNQKSLYNFSKFCSYFSTYLTFSKEPLIRTLVSTFKRNIAIGFIIAFFDCCLTMTTPILIQQVINYAGQTDKDLQTGITLVILIVFSRIFMCMLETHSTYQFSILGFDLTNTISVALFNKSLNYSLLSTDEFKVGGLVNMLQVDAQRLLNLCGYISNMVFLPFQLLFGLYLMYDVIGISFLFGLGVMLVMGVINYTIGRYQVKFQKLLMTAKDARMKVTTELFGAIKFIKANAWEEYFYSKLDQKRLKELSYTKKRFICGSLSIFSLWVTPMLIINATFAGFVMLGNIMTPVRAFTVISIFSILQEPIRSIPVVINQFIETYISVKRVEKYLRAEEINRSFITYDPLNKDNKTYALKVERGNFFWRDPNEKRSNNLVQPTQSYEQDNALSQEVNSQPQIQDTDDISQRMSNDKQKININGESYMSSFQNKSVLNQEKIHGTRENNTLENAKDPEIQTQKSNSTTPLILKDINIQVPIGKMVAFVGEVGCGKSSLLYSLIGEMKFNDESSETIPRVEINGTVSLVNQKPWILNTTVRENILFGKQYDEKKYTDCVKYSCLTSDFAVLVEGDLTQIGEKGVNLSGGQKARISLARSLYSESDILLLDDILSAVDVNVGKSIVHDCLKQFRKNSTRIIATHALHYLKHMDYIYIMKEGSVVQEGNYEDISQSYYFKEMYDKYMKEQFKKTGSALLASPEHEETVNEDHYFVKQCINQPSLSEESSALVSKKQSQDDIVSESEMDSKEYLILKEERKKGTISWHVVKRFCSLNGGSWYVFGVLITMLFWQGLKLASSIWIAEWTENNDVSENDYYLMIFSIISISYGIFAFIRAVICLSGSVRESRITHREMISALIFAPLNEFFERVPLGRILNIVSKDLQVLDAEIGYTIGSFMVYVFSTIGDTSLCVYSSSIYVLIPIFLFLFICKVMRSYYMNAQREVIRLEAVSRSPIISFFTESLSGLPTIRATNQQARFLHNHCTNIDENKKCQFSQISMESWFKQTLTFFSLIVNISAISFCFQMHSYESYSGVRKIPQQQVCYQRSLSRLIKMFSNSLECGTNSKRIWLLSNVATPSLSNFLKCLFSGRNQIHLRVKAEKGYSDYVATRQIHSKCVVETTHKENDQLNQWPQKGHLRFDNLFLKYRPNLPCVIKGISVEIQPAEKVGIVGRTGAGKSTITLALLRIIEAFQGRILIDGVDISQIELQELRRKVTIILQDPQLFEGTFRENIDPLNEHSDEDIIETLEQCQLQRFTQSKNGLSTLINDDGENLSVGEKQLICIARALLKVRSTFTIVSIILRRTLKKSKIVLIDEATANIDIQTDHLIQQTIARVFKNCTVLTIAHRLNTILNSDKILVLSEGQISEFDSPNNLLLNPESLFFSLYQESSKENNM